MTDTALDVADPSTHDAEITSYKPPLPEPESPITHGSVLAGALYLALTLLAPSPTNPRKTFPDSYIGELADSIRKVGVMQPIVVRPLPGAKLGGPQYEIVAGECRWRAAQRAGLTVIPAMVRDLSDLEVKELQLVENLRRQDLHPLEEAIGYEQLLIHPPHGKRRAEGYTIEQLADKVGVSVRQIYVTIQLLQLVPEGQDAMREGKLTRSVALLVARMPRELQPKALKDILAGWGGEPYSYRTASKLLRDRYMLSLVRAPFDIKDASLVEKTGACTTCPKRTGANPDLFDDVDSADVCTDPDCFERKKKAAGERVIEDAQAKGMQVIQGHDAHLLLRAGEYSLKNSGYLRLDRPAEELTGSKKQLQSLLGDAVTPLVVEDTYTGTPILVVRMDDVTKALKAKGLYRPTRPGGVGGQSRPLTPEDIKAQRRHRIEDLFDRRLPDALIKHFAEHGLPPLPLSHAWLLAIAKYIAQGSEHDLTQELARLLSHEKVTVTWTQDWLQDLSPEQLTQFILAVVLHERAADDMRDPNATARHADLLAEELGFNLPALCKDIEEEVAAAIRDEIEALKQSAQPARGGSKKATRARAAGASTPPKDAAAQGADTSARRGKKKAAEPADATEAFLAKHAPAPKATAKGKGKGKKKASQADEPAAPAGSTSTSRDRDTRVTLSVDAAWPFRDQPAAA